MKKFVFYASNIFKSLIPKKFSQRKLNYWLQQAENYSEETIYKRLDYYISNKNDRISSNAVSLKNFKRPKKGSMYYYDLVQYTRYFKDYFKIKYKFGDVQDNQEALTIVKSRPINHSGNSVIMKLNALRHYCFIDGDIPFLQKKNEVVWRGVIHKQNRINLVEKFHTHPKCNIGQITLHKRKPEWKKPFLSIKEQLKYKFILSIEGNDVATNLKWIMSSNSLCFMPTPKFETWFMEGKLIPNVHYVRIKDDYSDMIEKMEYYSKNENKALSIIQNAKKWVEQFKDDKLEKILSLKVLDSYFKSTGQKF